MASPPTPPKRTRAVEPRLAGPRISAGAELVAGFLARDQKDNAAAGPPWAAATRSWRGAGRRAEADDENPAPGRPAVAMVAASATITLAGPTAMPASPACGTPRDGRGPIDGQIEAQVLAAASAP